MDLQNSNTKRHFCQIWQHKIVTFTIKAFFCLTGLWSSSFFSLTGTCTEEFSSRPINFAFFLFQFVVPLSITINKNQWVLPCQLFTRRIFFYKLKPFTKNYYGLLYLPCRDQAVLPFLELPSLLHPFLILGGFMPHCYFV